MKDHARPDRLWFNGALRPWAEATVHVWTECATRGANVFEGIRAYWDEESGTYRAVALDRHLERLGRSARMLRIPLPGGILSDLAEGMRQLLSTEGDRTDCYLRPTVYVAEGRYGTTVDEVRISSYVVLLRLPVAPHGQPPECRLAVSRLRRIPEDCFPSRIKTGASYQALRLAAMDAHEAGADDAILLDGNGLLTETTGAALAIVRDGTVVIPHIGSGVLESITREIVLDLLADHGVAVCERPVGWSELLVCDETMILGTLAGVKAAVRVDGHPIGDGRPGPVTRLAVQLYDDRCRTSRPGTPPWIQVLRPARREAEPA